MSSIASSPRYLRSATARNILRVSMVGLWLVPFAGMAQIGIGTTSPHPSAMLHISAGAGNNKGLLVPKVTSASRVVLDSTQNIANGLVLFDTDLQKFYYFGQSPRTWKELDHDWIRKDVAGSGATIGTHIYSGVSGNVGIGTASNVNPAAKLTVVGSFSQGSASFTQDSVPGTNHAVFSNWVGIGTRTRTGTVEFDVRGQANISSHLTVGGTVTGNKFVGEGVVPTGGIIMFSGTVTGNFTNGMGVTGTEYEGWALCDGRNGTPDLRGRFVVGKTDNISAQLDFNNSERNLSDYLTIGDHGGLREVTLDTTQMPTHNHGGRTGNDGDHSHDYEDRYRGGNWDVLEDVSSSLSRDLGSNQPDHSRSTSSDGDHDHTINNQGGGQPHENRPPYYVLAFIKKL